MKINKRYTIKFSYSGISQYADFHEVKGKLYKPSLRISYCKIDETPDVSNMTTIEEILEEIKKVSYCNQAEIYLINGAPVNYHNNKKAQTLIKSFDESFENFIEAEAKKFFDEILEPMMIKNKWFISYSHIGMPIIIGKNEENEWDNVHNDFDFQYLCLQFVSKFREVKDSFSLRSENGNYISNMFSSFYGCISTEYFKEKGYLIEEV